MDKGFKGAQLREERATGPDLDFILTVPAGSKRKKCKKAGRVRGNSSAAERAATVVGFSMTSSQVQTLEKYGWVDGWKYGVVYVCVWGSRFVAFV